MWLPKKLREAKDQGPWVLVLIAFLVAFAISAFFENIVKLKSLVDEAVIAGVVPHSASKQTLAYWLFVILFGLALACIFFVVLYLLAEWERREAVQNFDERKTKAFQTLQGMMRAASRIRTQTYPAIAQPERTKTLDRHHFSYEIDKQFNARVIKRYSVRTLKLPLHFWQQSFSVRDAADPAEYLVDIDFEVRDLSGRSELVYLPTENDGRSKAVSLYFLPQIAVGEAARKIEVSYTWKGMCKSLELLGEEQFNFNYDSLEPVGEVLLEVYLEPGTDGVISGEIAGSTYPNSSVTPIKHPETGWPGFRYEVRNAPAGARVSHAVLAKWRRP